MWNLRIELRSFPPQGNALPLYQFHQKRNFFSGDPNGE